MNGTMQQAIELVIHERLRQNAKWGDQSGNHPFEWMSILMEEVGELAEAVNETCFKTPHVKPELGGVEGIRREAIHVTAVALAIAEATLTTQNRSAGDAPIDGQIEMLMNPADYGKPLEQRAGHTVTETVRGCGA